MSLIVSMDELRGLVGQEVICGDWVVVDQSCIDRFADLSGDHQWIHTDPERAARDSPWGQTVAHGFLTIALFTRMMGMGIQITGTRLGVNYGFDRLRFTDTVRSGDRIRARAKLARVDDIKGGVQTVLDVTVEREGHEKPALVATWLLRRYV
jgi:acyl dehydratase